MNRLGWIPDFPDYRDFTFHDVKKILPTIESNWGATLPSAMSLCDKFSPVEDQKDLGSCTANAGVGVAEFYERSINGNFTNASRLFLYKVTRNLMKLKGDTGASLRATMGALVLFGTPPEDFYPYSVSKFDEEPPAFCYAFAENYKTISYFRHDPPNISTEELLQRIKTSISSGNPAMFGFTVYASIDQANKTGRIPFPSARERVLGGHAIVAVGYDDSLLINNSINKSSSLGALMIRNSWGEGWGEGGYGWLPYDYVLKGMAQDFWSILKKDWVNTDQFLKED
jgi:C1A family cysteine protease